jgi:hypothetical protein
MEDVSTAQGIPQSQGATSSQEKEGRGSSEEEGIAEIVILDFQLP